MSLYSQKTQYAGDIFLAFTMNVHMVYFPNVERRNPLENSLFKNVFLDKHVGNDIFSQGWALQHSVIFDTEYRIMSKIYQK